MKRCLLVVLVLAGCGLEDTVEQSVHAPPVLHAPQAGWGPVQITDGQRIDRTWRRGTLVREEAVEIPVEEVELRLTDASGRSLELVRSFPEQAPGLRFPPEVLAPGVWRLSRHRGDVMLGEPLNIAIGAHGQVDGFEVDRLEGAYFVLFEPSPVGVGSVLRIVGSEVQDRLALGFDRAEDGGWQARVYAPARDAPWCRVWTGRVEVGDTGIVAASEDVIAIEQGIATTLWDVQLRLGVDADAERLAGLELAATGETRDFDAFVEDDPDPPEGSTAKLLERLGDRLVACPSDGDPYCVRVHSFGGHGGRVRDVDTLEALETAEPCGGFDEDTPIGLVPCSTLGSVGVGGWLFGVGALLFRRRREA